MIRNYLHKILSAHLAGSIGRNLKSSDNFTISRITGKLNLLNFISTM